MTENSIEEERREEEEETSLSRGTIIVLAVCAFLVLGGVFLKYTLNLNINYEKECRYRGGVWNINTKECVYENGVGGVEQVGMKVSSVVVFVPDREERMIFENVEVGLEKAHSATFASGTVQGVLALTTSLGKVQKETQDLIMPFTVRVNGATEVAYIGVFKKTSEGYEQVAVEKVGSVVGQESLRLSPLNASSSYSARLSYRDRKDGESMTAIPTEPRVLDIIIMNHAIHAVSVVGREGVIRTKVSEEGE